MINKITNERNPEREDPDFFLFLCARKDILCIFAAQIREKV